MDPITQQAVLATAGAAGAGGALYVDDVFSPFLYTGNNTTNVINNGIDLAGEGGLVWAKCRNNSSASNGPHSLWDTERGTRQYLVPNTTAASYVIAAQYSQYGLQSFNSNGFTLGINWAYENNPSNVGDDMVSWTFRKAPGFFDIVTYTGNGTAGRTVAHNLGSVPGMIIVKCTSISDSWTIYHRGLGATKAIYFNDDTSHTNTGFWNDTEPTSTQFTVGNTGAVNATGSSFVAYVFAHDDASFGTNEDESIIKCGSYTGNGNVAGPTIDLGFEPQYVLIKSDDPNSNWEIADSMRGVHTGNADAMLSVDNISAEDSSNDRLDFTSTGFNIVNTANDFNANGKTHIYMAIRRPNKPPTAGTEVFTVGSQQINNLTPFYKTSGHISDFVLSRQPSSATNWQVNSRLTGTQTLQTNSNSSETSNSYYVWDYMDGMNSYATSGNNGYYHWSFKRAPGFMDVVAYAGTGSNQNVTHNLGVVPELMIIKARDVAVWWMAFTSAIDGSHDYLKLQATDAKTDSSLSLPTSTTIVLDIVDTKLNGASYNYISYLFATLPGISKVGTYSGTGNDVNVDCGFTAGARFVMIKRTDATGDWYVYDSVRGIVSGSDPYLLTNTTDAEVTNTDYIDPLNAGFTVTSSAPANLNASGGTYLFLAIA